MESRLSVGVSDRCNPHVGIFARFKYQTSSIYTLAMVEVVKWAWHRNAVDGLIKLRDSVTETKLSRTQAMRKLFNGTDKL